MESSEDKNSHQTNLMYFNQMVEEKGVKKTPNNVKKAAKRAPSSFGAQKVDFSDYLIAPSGYESVVYPLYFLLIPYITGALVLFFFVAGASIDNFLLLDLTDSSVVVWLLGYEIVATLLLIAIFISFLKYDPQPEKVRHF